MKPSLRLTRRALPMLALAAVLAAAGVSDVPSSPALDPASMDKTCNACEDFNRYASGGWRAKNPVPADHPSWGSFAILAERNREALRGILERAAANKDAAPGSEEKKIGDFYSSCMDEAGIESAGIHPLDDELGRIAKISNAAQLQAEIARLHARGVRPLFVFVSQQDRRNSTEVIAAASQGGLGLPDRDYYVKTDEKSAALRKGYVDHVAKMLVLAGAEPSAAEADAKTVLAIETKLAEASMTRVERRDADATYHRTAIADLKPLTPDFDWTAYFQGIAAPALPAVNVSQPKFFGAMSAELAARPLADWKVYLRWHLLHAAAASLPKKFVEEDFDFFERTLQGTKEMPPRWKRCVAATDAALGFALGHAFVNEQFPPQAKERADRMVKNLVAALEDDLRRIPWMGEETRRAALEKLRAFTPKIGYPDKWRDYSSLTVDRGPFAGNVERASAFEVRRDLGEIGKPVDRTKWGMTPPTVNAYYNPSRNEIVFPAGILQPPFFNASADDAVNYGGIGAVIGHEMTHGFDDQGRKFDAQGNLKDWWTDQDRKNYEARASCVEKQFSGYLVEPGLNENGKLVLGESIADLGGLAIAYAAFEKSLEGKPRPAAIDGLSPEQRFFVSWATVWAANARPEFERLQVATNPHPLPRFRAIGPPSNLPEFAKAFGCPAGSPMVRPEPCRIW
ncbi:MAG TPA: M13 family metallopeptidase [Thermoanaerobaculia bacterium]